MASSSKRAKLSQTPATEGSTPPGGRTEPDKVAPILTFEEEMGIGMIVLTVGVGPNQRVFQVHRKLLCRKIEYFQKMFGGQFKEAINNSATFPENDPQYFDILMRWVYHGQLPQLALIQQNGVRSWNWRPLHLYLLADKFRAHEVMDRVIDEIAKHWNNCESGTFPATRTYGMVYSLTPEGSPLRRLYSELFVHVIIHHSKAPGDKGGEDYKGLPESYPDLARDVLSVLLAANGSFKNPGIYSQTCRFHIHPEAEVCPWAKLDRHGLKEG